MQLSDIQGFHICEEGILQLLKYQIIADFYQKNLSKGKPHTV